MRPEGNGAYELVVVSYRSSQPLALLLDAVEGVPTIVVDNAAGSDGVRDLTATRSSVRYIAAEGNVGFAAAANMGAGASDADVVIFVNPDCLPSVAVLDELARTVSDEPDVAACAPALRGADGRVSRQGGGWAPTIGRCLLHAVGGHLLVRSRGIWFVPRLGEVLELGWLAGTCLAVRRTTFLDAGGFDDSYFLYNEDMELGYRFRRRGVRQILRGDLAVRHSGGSSSAVPPVGVWLLRAASLGRYIQAHNGRIASFCMRVTLGAGSLLRAGGFAVSSARRHRTHEMLTYSFGILRPERATALALASLSASHRPSSAPSKPGRG